MKKNDTVLPSKKIKRSSFHAVSVDGHGNLGIVKNGKAARTLPGRGTLNNHELEKSKGVIIVEIIEYVPNAVLIKTIIKKTTGTVSAMSFDTGEGLTEKTSPFDTFAQIIDGNAEIVIDGVSNLLGTGEGIILPAHRPNIFRANERFKMILTVIKSGYE